jgi:DNA-binding transcriptional ArsR family regulator
VAGLDLAPLIAIQTSDNYNPDFINPPPSSPLADLEEELAVMVATPAAQIRMEVLRAHPDGNVPAVLLPLVEHPKRAIRALAELMRSYWEVALAEDWPRIRSLLDNDVLHRARQITDGGTQRLFADLDPAVSWREGVLRIECRESDVTLELDERGLLFVPSAFIWPKVTIVTAPPWQPTLIYPARGVGMLWSPERPASPHALARLLGRNRAAILAALDQPRSTSELARVLELTAGGVSQHLAVLRAAGLVSSRRVQRAVLYLRSPEGDALVRAGG